MLDLCRHRNAIRTYVGVCGSAVSRRVKGVGLSENNTALVGFAFKRCEYSLSCSPSHFSSAIPPLSSFLISPSVAFTSVCFLLIQVSIAKSISVLMKRHPMPKFPNGEPFSRPLIPFTCGGKYGSTEGCGPGTR